MFNHTLNRNFSILKNICLTAYNYKDYRNILLAEKYITNKSMICNNSTYKSNCNTHLKPVKKYEYFETHNEYLSRINNSKL